MNADPRIEDLQILLSHQGLVIEDLSEEVRRQGAAIDRLEAVLRQFADRLQQAEPAPAIDRPPHY
ncbi:MULTISPECIES: SlyX family protein [unclassified Aureimonas]|uniref:SlyX family protein n=1 Tax=unclassified Aureimonas TaxID=2615206 RepID=UPI0006FFE9D5|nr:MULTISPECIES: SlyX family protein [unclassified Aureimonas]KQT53846.1 hypothetical protein ASG62_11410 [Aureimonas sp. Leaf427]KQT71713.1 hypothetical protein ASG54_19750 [Aureimonas sp. Leaf460]